MDAMLGAVSRGFEQLLDRATGPLNFRLVIMPAVVTILAIRAHLRDVREGNPLFVGAFITSPTERRRLLRSGLRDFGRIFLIACGLDAAYQIWALKAFYPVQMLIVAVGCAVVPYFFVRGPVTRLAHLLYRRWSGAVVDPSTPAPKADPEDRERLD